MFYYLTSLNRNQGTLANISRSEWQDEPKKKGKINYSVMCLMPHPGTVFIVQFTKFPHKISSAFEEASTQVDNR